MYKGDANYDLFRLALKSTSKRLYPNYANLNVSFQTEWVNHDRKDKEDYINSLDPVTYNELVFAICKDKETAAEKLLLRVNEKDEKIEVIKDQLPIEIMSTMGCRTQNGYDVWAKDDFKKNVESFIKDGSIVSDVISAAQKDGRGNIAPTTIILPTLAMESKNNVEKMDTEFLDKDSKEELIVEDFIRRLYEAIDDAKDSLIERFNHICAQPMESAKFMYENHLMAGYDGETTYSALKHGTLAIGQLGLAETLQILIGEDHTSEKGMELAKRIESLFKDRCDTFKNEYKLNFGVYYTPAENLCYTAMTKFKEKYGEIENVSDKSFFTNSMHVPVYSKLSPFEKIDVESQLTGFSSAGCITYIELDSSVTDNVDALEQYVLYAMNHDIPYKAVNLPNDICLDCGYTGEIDESCPCCGSKKMQRLRRVTGYLTGDYETAFNPGKQEEVKMRYKHTLSVSDPRQNALLGRTNLNN